MLASLAGVIFRAVMRWIGVSLTRKFIASTAIGLLTISLVFLVAFKEVYRAQIEDERAGAATGLSRLLQASLENAMLKRDLDGLREIVSRLGAQAGINNAMILNPDLEVRFASNPKHLGRQFGAKGTANIALRSVEDQTVPPFTQFTIDEQGCEVLRSVNPVRNKEPCTQCHGPIEESPINGILVVDYEAKTIREKARHTALMLIGAGSVVVLLTVTGGWWFVNRFVLSPMVQLTRASRALAEGRFDVRVHLQGSDELAQLARLFNEMAENIQNTVREERKKEVFLQSLIDAIPDGIRVINGNRDVVMVNQAYRAQMRQEVNEVVGASLYSSSSKRMETSPSELGLSPLQEVERTGKPVKTIQQIVRQNGVDLYAEVFSAPMQIQQNGREHLFFVESIRDLASQIQYSHEQKLAALGQIARGVAHEIHNPLASIRLALQSTLRAIQDDNRDSDELRNYLKHVDGEIDKCIDVTDRLLRLSVPGIERAELVSVNDAIAETVSLLAYEGSLQGIVMDLDLARPDVRVMSTESDIRIVVLNLVQNAFHAMPKGGRLHIISCGEDEDAKMIFEDTGMGIRSEDFPHIFDPFFSRRTDESRSTGLGLSICKSIAERYDGRIEVKSRVGVGTRFTVTLPNADWEERTE